MQSKRIQMSEFSSTRYWSFNWNWAYITRPVKREGWL